MAVTTGGRGFFIVYPHLRAFFIAFRERGRGEGGRERRRDGETERETSKRKKPRNFYVGQKH